MNPQKAFIVACQDEAEKCSWMNDLKRCIEDAIRNLRENSKGDESRILELSQSSRSLSFKKSQSEAKIDVSFSAALGSTDTSICKLCIRKFGKLSRRPYRCPYCRQSVCGDCSSRKAVIRGSKSPVRQQPVVKVCDTCHGLITGEVKPDDPILIQE